MKYLTLLLTMVFILFSLSSCAENVDDLFSSPAVDNSYLNYGVSEFYASSSAPALKIGLCDYSGNCNPLFYKTATDEAIVKMFSVSLFEFDKNVVTNESIAKYETIDNADDFVVYSFKIRDDIRYFDGEVLNVDDVIFSMYVLSDPQYDGNLLFYNLPIRGMEQYRNGSADKIDGIVRKEDFSFEIWLDCYDSNFLSCMSFPIVPMHHYGNSELYNYAQNSFGFNKGDVESIKLIKSNALGAGPYKIDQIDDGVIRMSRNKKYYKGEPKVPLIEIYDISDKSGSERMDLILNDTLDIIDVVYNAEISDYITNINKSETEGEYIEKFLLDNNGYGYIGICADTVKVGNDKDSFQSKNLRKAFATLFAVYRESAIHNYYGDGAELINYPISNSSCLAPVKSDARYKNAYSLDINGNEIYYEGMSSGDIYASALTASKEYFIAAGFVFDEVAGRFISAPEGASLRYDVILNGNGVGDHPCYDILLNAKNAFLNLGIVLEIHDVQNSDELWLKLSDGSCQIWAAAFNTELDDSLFMIFHSSQLGKLNRFGIDDEVLDAFLSLGRISDESQRKLIYTDSFDVIFDWGIIVPVYQRKHALVVNTSSVDTALFDNRLKEQDEWVNFVYLFEKRD